MPLAAIIATIGGSAPPPTVVNTWLAKDHWAAKHFVFFMLFLLKGLQWSNILF